MFEWVIIGAGVIGCMVARQLARYQGSVALLESADDVSCGASRANSGIVHGGFDDKPGSLKAQLVRRGNLAFDALNAELNFGFQRIGSLVLSYSEADCAHLQRLRLSGQQNGVGDLRLVQGEELQQLQPGLPPAVRSALFCPSAGVASPYELTIALAENAVDNGASLKLNHRVEAIRPHAAGWELHTSAGPIIAGTVINCAGVESDVIARMVGDESFRIIPRRGDYLIFDRKYLHPIRRVLFRCPSSKGKGVLLSPTVYGNLLLGPNAHEMGDTSHPEPTLAGLEELVERANEMFPGIDYGRAIRAFSGLRATPDGGDFIIRPAGGVAGFYHLAGIESPGLTASPAIVDLLLTQLATAGRLGPPRRDFNPYRPALIGVRPAQEYLSPPQLQQYSRLPMDDPRRIICRCEQVNRQTMREILSRSTPVTSVAAMKRRSRAGMGSCQGAFCSTLVTELLRQHHGQVEIPADNQSARAVLQQLKEKLKSQ